jgi:pimeloyl-ACP methyl ester carboxylesterase
MHTLFSEEGLEYAWLGDPAAPGAVWVFLHEGLGSVSMWRDWPERVCAQLGVRGLVYSRSGYGQSRRVAGFGTRGSNRFAPDYMHIEAWAVLPRLLAELGIERPVLLGHSDGATIALLHAARHDLAGCAVMAPHLFAQSFALDAITQTTAAYESGLKDKLARHHADVDTAFWQWSDAWLNPVFAAYNIEAECSQIRCPLLAIQGFEDEYGTMAQLDALARCAPQTQQLRLERCGHSPHRDQSESVVGSLMAFSAAIKESKKSHPRQSS